MPACSQLTTGNPLGPPLIFLHGFLGCKEDWLEVLPFFEEHYRCITLDLPGHGAAPYSGEILEVVGGMLARFTSPKPIVIGYSMGGRIALQLSRYARAMVILSAHPGLKTDEEKLAQKKIEDTWCEKLNTLPLEAFLKEWYAQPLFHSSRLSQRRLKQDPASLAKVMQQMGLSRQRYCAEVTCPSLFLYGEKDGKYRDIYTGLSQGVSVQHIEEAGHACHLEQPERCAEAILHWLAGRPGTTTNFF